MQSIIYNQKGQEVGKTELPERVFGLSWNEKLVHQVVTSMTGNARIPIAHTKNRGEVSGTGKKPWKQKGTGRARHGSRRSPIWVGGGVAHGPRNERDYSRKINKKMKTQALFTVLSRKFNDGQIIFMDNLEMQKPKTAEAKKTIDFLSKIKGFEKLGNKKNVAFLSLSEPNPNTEKSFSNFNNMEVGLTKDLNPLDILNYKYLILENPEESIKTLSKRSNKK
ncbi:MAG: 50S ribosomal protein L4 [Patescibacteria group bacterium]